jgi:HEAT repeat protein
MRNAVIVVFLGLGLALAPLPARAESAKERAQKLMKKLAKEKNPEERAEAATQLGDMGAWDAVPALAAALKDKAPQVRANAAYALTKLKEHAQEAVPALKEALQDPDGTTRLNAAVALSNMKAATPAELAPAIAPLLRDPDKETQELALKLLLNLGFEDKDSRAVLIEALDKGQPEVRNAILNELWKMHFRGSEPGAKELIALLVDMSARDRDPKVRRMSIIGLRSLKPLPPAVGQALLKALDDPDPEVASAAAGSLNSIEGSPLPQTAVTHLVQTLKTGATPRARAGAAHTLGNFMGWREKFLPAMTLALSKDADASVRAAVADALGELRAEEGITPLLQAVKADPDPKVRARACRALPAVSKIVIARVGKLDATLAALTAASKDPDSGVQQAAQSAAEDLRK